MIFQSNERRGGMPAQSETTCEKQPTWSSSLSLMMWKVMNGLLALTDAWRNLKCKTSGVEGGSGGVDVSR